jgi:hypothetical protein
MVSIYFGSADVLRPALCADVGGVIRAPSGPGPDAVGDLAHQVAQAGGPGLCRSAFISVALRELSVARCRGNVPVSVGREPLAGSRCAVVPGPRLTWLKSDMCLVCGFNVFGSAALCVALPCFVPCMCDCT